MAEQGQALNVEIFAFDMGDKDGGGVPGYKGDRRDRRNKVQGTLQGRLAGLIYLASD